jgi:hypothetical protein
MFARNGVRAAVLVGGVLVGVLAAPPAIAAVIVTALDGDVRSGSKLLSPHSRIADGDAIETGAEGRVSVLVDGSAVVSLCGSSRASFSSTPQRTVRVEIGSVHVAAVSRLRVLASDSVSTVTGTSVYVSIDATTGAAAFESPTAACFSDFRDQTLEQSRVETTERSVTRAVLKDTSIAAAAHRFSDAIAATEPDATSYTALVGFEAHASQPESVGSGSSGSSASAASPGVPGVAGSPNPLRTFSPQVVLEPTRSWTLRAGGSTDFGRQGSVSIVSQPFGGLPPLDSRTGLSSTLRPLPLVPGPTPPAAPADPSEPSASASAPVP